MSGGAGVGDGSAAASEAPDQQERQIEHGDEGDDAATHQSQLEPPFFAAHLLYITKNFIFRRRPWRGPRR